MHCQGEVRQPHDIDTHMRLTHHRHALVKCDLPRTIKHTCATQAGRTRCSIATAEALGNWCIITLECRHSSLQVSNVHCAEHCIRDDAVRQDNCPTCIEGNFCSLFNHQDQWPRRSLGQSNLIEHVRIFERYNRNNKVGTQQGVKHLLVQSAICFRRINAPRSKIAVQHGWPNNVLPYGFDVAADVRIRVIKRSNDKTAACFRLLAVILVNHATKQRPCAEIVI